MDSKGSICSPKGLSPPRRTASREHPRAPQTTLHHLSRHLLHQLSTSSVTGTMAMLEMLCSVPLITASMIFCKKEALTCLSALWTASCGYPSIRVDTRQRQTLTSLGTLSCSYHPTRFPRLTLDQRSDPHLMAPQRSNAPCHCLRPAPQPQRQQQFSLTIVTRKQRRRCMQCRWPCSSLDPGQLLNQAQHQAMEGLPQRNPAPSVGRCSPTPAH